jgi:hypothetical protein
MKDLAELVSVFPTQIARKLLCEGVANRVRMAGAFALDHLDVVVASQW